MNRTPHAATLRPAVRWAAVVAFATALAAPLLSAVPAQAAEPAAVVRDGSTQTSAAASCWEAKQVKPSATDGVYWLQTPQLVTPRKFYCDMTTDGGGWVLIGRGRQGWTYDYNGQGSADAIAETPSGTSAFSVSQLDAHVVDALLGGKRVDSMTDGVRVRRARNAAGTQFQEASFTFRSRDRWSWSLAAGFPVASAKIDGSSAGTTTTRDISIDDSWKRLWTHESSANDYVRGFNYGSSATGGSTASDNFLYSSRSDGRYPSPFSQVFVRPKIRTADLDYSAVPSSGLPATTMAAIPQNGAIPTTWGVSGTGAAGTGENATEVQAFAQIGNVMYVGGNFTTVQKGENATGSDKVSRAYLAAFDATTGDYLPGFAPPALNNQVKSLAVLPGGKLAVGGEFTTVGGTSRPGLVVVDGTTGAVDTAWNVKILNKISGGIVSIRALDVGGDYLYLGGAMTHFAVGSTETYAKGAGRIKISTRTPDASWNPEFNGTVTALDVSTDVSRVYFAGYFTKAGTADALRGAAFSTASGAARITPTWTPTFSTAGSARYQQAIKEVGSRVWLGGSQHSLFGYDRSTFALNKAHITKAGGDSQAIESGNGLVFQGCHCEDWNYSDTTNYDGTSPGNTSVSWSQADEIDFIGAYDASTGDYVPDFTPTMRARNGMGIWAIKVATDGTVWTGGSLRSAISTKGTNQWVGGFARFAARPHTAPGKPGGAAAGLSGTDATVSWTPSSTAGVTYEVLRNDRVVATTRSMSVVVPGSTANDSFFVRAADDAGNRSATTASFKAVEGSAAGVLVPAKSTWSYLFDDTVSVPANWAQPTYAAAGWKSGTAPFGFGANGSTTDIDVPSGTRRAVVSYYRKSFDIEPGSTFGTVTLTTRADDAVAAYVNGVEVGRSNLGTGDLSGSSYAQSAPRTAAAVAAPVSFEVPVSALREGTNTVAISVHSMYRSTLDSSMDATVTATAGTNAPKPALTTLLAQKSTWSYLFDDSVSVPASWKQPTFDSSGWKSGAAPLGFGDNGVTTDVDVPSGTRRAVVSYYRTTFDVPQGATYGTVTLTTRADDAVAAYVNGVEVGRSNLDSGELSGASYAKTAPRTSTAVGDPVTFEVPVSALRPGTNTVAISVHSMYRATPDSSMDAMIRATDGSTAVVAPPAAPTNTALVAEKSSWSYLFSADATPPATWKTASTGTGDWASGAAPLGWGSGPITTDIDVPADQTRALTSYFRRTFSVSDPSAFAELTLTTRADDGIVVYVNGTEAARENLPAGDITANTYALSAPNTATAVANEVTVQVPTSLLTAGTNTIAVEVHSNYRSTQSSSMDLSLVGTS
jgi:hypothetical protein